MSLEGFSRKSAEKAPGQIRIITPQNNREPIENTTENIKRNSTKTKVKSFSLPIDILQELDDYMDIHHERSASKVVTEALKVFLRNEFKF